MVYAWFQVSASMHMKFAPFWEFTLRRMAVSYRRFGTCTETSVRNCHSTYRELQKER